MTNLSSTECFDSIIKARKTEKVLGNLDAPLPLERPLGNLVAELLELAAWAPFHKPADQMHRQLALDSIVPWRFYTLETAVCRALLGTLKTWAKEDSSWLNGKIPHLLATADVLFQVTWLPNPAQDRSAGLFEASKENMEHIAAASAAIQNVLLGATARAIPNYWASGGTLLRAEIFDLLGIPRQEIVLGSIFLFPPELSERKDLKLVPGSWRDKRGAVSTWSKTVAL